MPQDIFDISNSQFAQFHAQQAEENGDMEKYFHFVDCWYLEPGLIRIKELPTIEAMVELSIAASA